MPGPEGYERSLHQAMPIRAPRKLFSFTLSASLREAWGGDLIPLVAIQEREELDALSICPSWGLPYLPVPTPCPSSCAVPLLHLPLFLGWEGDGYWRVGVSIEGVSALTQTTWRGC